MNLLAPYMAALKLGAALALAALLAWALLALRSHEQGIGEARVTAAWDHANKVAEEARQKRTAEARKEERQLQYSENEDRRKLNALRDHDDAALLALLGELRQRPLRPASAGQPDLRVGAPGPGAEAGCTGASLYRDDAEFLARQSRVAAGVLAQRDACYSAYERAQERLRAFSGRQPGER